MSTFAQEIRPYVQAELVAAAETELRGDPCLTLRRLESAHVLSQAATFEHVRVHAHMLRYAFRQSLAREALGQFLRMTLAAPLSMVGLIPVGNTGGSNVNGPRRMPVPADPQETIDAPRLRAG